MARFPGHAAGREGEDGVTALVLLVVGLVVGGGGAWFVLSRHDMAGRLPYYPVARGAADPVQGTDEDTIAVDDLPVALLVLARNGRLLHAGARAQNEFAEGLGTMIRHPALQRAVSELQPGNVTEVRIEADVPVRRVVQAFVKAARWHGQPACVVVLLDATARDALDRARSDFVAHASHELRTPLAALIGFIETLQGPAANDAVARQKFLAIMARQASRMQRLIDRLLYLSRVQMLEHQRPQGQVVVAELLGRFRDELQGKPAGERAALVVHDAPPGSLRGDADQILQVLVNLCENALRYGRPQAPAVARIEVGAQWLDTGGLLLSVRDNGPGIEPQHLPRLTERFYRITQPAGRNTGDQGTGLGLAIVRHIVDRHGGRLDITSVPGEGTRCTVWLPGQPPVT
ncbi:two-component sensor histidine kinase [Komagataeibacter rhaeticus]|uniref:histidine kinase n=1 Tax=Komagataeibacter rhaeticus TaxID=215221 RepID=A0A858JMP9_9PROT|nr:two-component sensor histidine kinase [Komagataeibacter rhaeticus]PYD54451.1 two-component sensor histidine kinase [Komagataeibacter rhaeticus]QIP36962.1 two-component sensor histidine kinase [Komagataeibacter rhaeticus]QOC48121.1 two-component sensor histidine kinase [Komagataeibacter rhaeticus]